MTPNRPVSFAFAISAGVQAAAAGGMYAVARARIGKYLQQVNKEYFIPRGLQARIAKQKLIPEITGQPPDAPLLSEVRNTATSPGHEIPIIPPLRERRLAALEGYIAPLEWQDLPAHSDERNPLDKLSAKMLERKEKRQEKKIAKHHEKGHDKERKEGRKLQEEEEKLAHEVEKVNRKADEELRKKPEEAAKIEEKRAEEMRKIEKDRAKAHGKFEEKVGKAGEHEGRAAKKFMWIVIQNLQMPSHVQGQT